MAFLAALRSQLVNLRVFRAFFPPGRTVREAWRLPRDLLGDGRAGAFPAILDVNVTSRCNLRCSFCYNRDNQVPVSRELDTGALLRLVKEAAPHRAGFFLGGGEPFVREDLLDVLATIKARGLPAGVVTNGTLLDGAAVDRLVRIGVDTVVVSLHGGEELHDRLAGTSGAWRKALEVIRLLARKMPPPGPLVNCVLGPGAAEDLPDFATRLRGERNAVLRLAHPSFLRSADAAAHAAAWTAAFGTPAPGVLSPVEDPPREAFDGLLAALRHPALAGILTKPVLSPSELRSWYSPEWRLRRRCLVIWRAALINADGGVLPCQYYLQPAGYVPERPLRELWNGPELREFRRVLRHGLLPGCRRCCKL
ncbi:MAG: radical SAM protein [Deltaproteobacteria bacterium]|nr:radical SAM protein [Deltaproteobacteria bacterium]